MENNKKVSIGNYLYISFVGQNKEKVILFNDKLQIKFANINNKQEKKLFIIEAVELGAKKSFLAKALNVSRQSIDNYLSVYKHFGIEGLIHSYSPRHSKRVRTHRQGSAEKRQLGDKIKEVNDLKKEAKQTQVQLSLPLEEPVVEDKDQPFYKEHEWTFSRYAGIFVYLITLIVQYDWLKLIQRYVGSGHKLFLAFMLMAARNIRSIEQFKNVRLKEAAKILGLAELPSRKRIRTWLVQISELSIADHILNTFFSHQLRAGIVGLWLWFTDGHLLTYTGKEKLRPAYNTQRRLMVPGRTNMVTTDHTGRIIDFQIQEGKGHLKEHIVALDQKWRDELPEPVVHVFDREGDGKDFFHNLSKLGIHFVTWEKNINTKKMEALDDDSFTEEFHLNGKKYRIFEGQKTFTITAEERFRLRRIYIWNLTSNRRTCGLSNVPKNKMSSQECALAILNRWGMSENTFKHLQERHPLHNEPKFNMMESDYQEMANPELKVQKGLLTQIRSGLNSLYKKLSKTKETFNKDGSSRKNSARVRLQREIKNKEAELKAVQKELKKIPERIDCSKLDDYQNFKRINNESKNLFDFVVSSVWNARKQMVEWLQPIYQNKNEYVDLFYAITRCHGWIQSDPVKVTVRLEPLEQPSRRSAQIQFCRKLNSLKAKTPSGKLLRIEVGNKPL